jgi:hypothetical protein
MFFISESSRTREGSRKRPSALFLSHKVDEDVFEAQGNAPELEQAPSPGDDLLGQHPAQVGMELAFYDIVRRAVAFI